MKNRGRIVEIIGILKENDVTSGMNPHKLRNILDALGPTFVKLGQIMSMRSDLLPLEYCKELEGLRMDVKPVDFEIVQRLLNENYGGDYRQVFKYVNPNPIGSASIAQVHEAYLVSGEHVVLKIQRPNIYQRMEQDVRILRRLARFSWLVDRNMTRDDIIMVIDEMWAVAKQELDFLIEANNIEEFAKNNEEFKYIRCPEVNIMLTTQTVLVMDYLGGYYIDDVKNLEKEEYDLQEIARKLAMNYINQILEDGYFHADPHPGNILIDDGKITWIDLGMMGRITSRDRRLVSDAINAILEHDIYQLKTVLLAFGSIRGEIDHTQLYEDLDYFVSKYLEMDLSKIDLGVMIEELFELTNNHSIGLPSGVSMLARGIITIEGVIATIAPTTNFLEIFAYRIRNFDSQMIKKEAKAIFNNLILSLRSSANIPKNINNTLRMFLRGQSKLNIEFSSAPQTLHNIRRIVYLMIVGLIVSALLISSSILCMTTMEPRVFDMPVVAFLGYLGAIGLMGIIFVHYFKNKL